VTAARVAEQGVEEHAGGQAGGEGGAVAAARHGQRGRRGLVDDTPPAPVRDQAMASSSLRVRAPGRRVDSRSLLAPGSTLSSAFQPVLTVTVMRIAPR
jgi:hypothetical protein